jgi:hypothetical protein
VPEPLFREALNRARAEMQTFVHNDAIVRAGDAIDEGEYIKSITSTGYGPEGFTLQSDVPQAWYLEYGTGLYGPKRRAYEINPIEARALANWSEYVRAKAIREVRGSWPQGMRKTPHSYLKWYEGARPIFALQVIAPGMHPEPNLGPAIFENIDEQEKMIERHIVEAWD